MEDEQAVSESLADDQAISEPVAGDELVSEPVADDEPVPEPEAADQALPGGASYWEPSVTGSQSSMLYSPHSGHLQREGPVRWLGVPPVLVYGLLLALTFTGVLGFGLWMRDHWVPPGSTTADAPASSAGGNSQLGVGGGVGVPDATAMTVRVTVGETVYLGLPSEPGRDPWQVSSSDPAVLTPVKSALGPAPGTTMVAFKAIGVGKAVITATLHNSCPPGQQCAETTRQFEESVDVVPG